MTSEKRVWIASLISAVLMLVYLQVIAKPGQALHKKEFTQHPQQQVVIESDKSFIPQIDASEETIVIESSKLKLDIGKQSAVIHRVTLKDAKQLSTGNFLTFGDTYPIMVINVGEKQIEWKLENQSESSASWKSDLNDVEVSMVLSLDEKDQTAEIALGLLNTSQSNKAVQLAVISQLGRSDDLTGNNNVLEATLKTKKSGWQREYLKYMGTGDSPRIVPRGTTMLTLSERYFCLSLKPWDAVIASLLPVGKRGETIASSLQDQLTLEPGEQTTKTLKFYVGPRDYFHMKESGFQDAFNLGILSRIGLILMVFLKGLAGIANSYGVAIILLSLLVTLCFSPFTIMSLRSMKKMQALQPRIQQLKKKHEKDPQRLNQETFALFKEHKVSPLSGCLPMLLPLPVFFAIWSAISHVIEIRGQNFLWIKDLSLPDHLATLPMGIPLNVLPIIMAGAMYLQTKLSQQQMPSQDASTKIMTGPIMPILFGFMFYQLPSGLVLYWLMNSVGSIAIYRLVKS